MQIVDRGILAKAEPNSSRAALTFPALISLPDSSILAFVHAGSSKDCQDESIEIYRSNDGSTWQYEQRLTCEQEINGVRGGIRIAYPTQISDEHLMLSAMFVDHTSYPGQPLFNADTEGCLPMYIILADSFDNGRTWSEWRYVELPEEIGPASLTSPITQLADGTLVMSIETNKSYLDTSPWEQKVVMFHSKDQGKTWGEPVIAGFDPSGRIFNWDQRVGLAPDGTLGTFVWTYDRVENRYLNVHRRISHDGGYTWSQAQDLGFTDQAGCPAILPDGRVVLPWVDRFETHSIRARIAANIEADFDPASEVELYALQQSKADTGDNTGALLADMSIWTFGLPFAMALPDGDVLVTFYAGTGNLLDIQWVRLRP